MDARLPYACDSSPVVVVGASPHRPQLGSTLREWIASDTAKTLRTVFIFRYFVAFKCVSNQSANSRISGE
jgi:hypothetical protein